MMLVTVVRYRAITGDQTSTDSEVTARVEEATDELEAVLDRPLAEGEYTERLYPTRDGRLWPKATPITDGGDYTVDGNALIASLPWPFDHPITGEVDYIEVTYTGGFLERTADPDAANRLPSYIERDLAWAAHRLLHPAATVQVPAGAVSAKVGDASVTFGPGGAPAGVDQLSGAWSARTRGWRYRTIGGAP